MALASVKVRAYGISLHDAPELIDRLDIRGVPVVFVNSHRLSGSAAEWILVQRVAIEGNGG